MGKAAAFLMTVAALALAPAVTANHSPWPDARHGWETRCDRDGVCSLYSTEDGGRHWHRIFDGETDDVMGFLRTSATGGVISINQKAPEQYWTLDNGRHWYLTRRLPAFWQGGVNLAGRGSLLFWSRGPALYRVANWLPPRKMALRVRRIAVLVDASFEDLAWTPRGAVGAALRKPGADARLVRVVIRRGPKNFVVPLRDPDPNIASRTDSLRLFASWPELTLLAEDNHGNPLYTWSSDDGGRTWSTPAS